MDRTFLPDADLLLAAGDAQQRLHAQAGLAAREHFGRKVFVRGVVEVSNYCRENCTYCGMRRDNRGLDRFRADTDKLLEMLVHHRPEVMTDLNIQSGEDPVAAREIVVPLVRALRRETDLGISVCLGTLNDALYADLREAGASLYIMKFEVAGEAVYQEMQSPGTLAERVRHIRQLAANGWFVSSGFIAGLPGQTVESALENLRLAADLPLDGCSVSPFIPGDETPLSGEAVCNTDLALNCMAALRLTQPALVIPAVSALNLSGSKDGYRRGLRAGANLCTINLTPADLRGDYLLYKRDRFIMTEERIRTAIESEGLQISAESLMRHLARSRPAPAAVAGS